MSKTWLEDRPSTFYLSNIFHRVTYKGRDTLKILEWLDARSGELQPETEAAVQARHDLVAEYLGLPPIDWAQVAADRALEAEWEARKPMPFKPALGEQAYGIVRTTWWGGESVDREWTSEDDDEDSPLLYRSMSDARYALPHDNEDHTYEVARYPISTLAPEPQ